MLQGEFDPLQVPSPLSTPPGPVLRPLDAFTGSLAGRAYQSLKEAILDIRYQPGEILRKAEICAQLGVSRSPVAEAVARLSAEGLVEVVPQAGTFVARFSMAEIREGAFLREALELAAVERLAEAISDSEIMLLRRNLRLQEVLLADGDLAGFHQADEAFHALMLGATGFRRLATLAQTSWVHVNRARQLLLPAPGRAQATLVEHGAIIDALAAHDPALARLTTRDHLRQLVTFLEPLAAARPELFALA
ncbi:MAG: GntR family transcriptional regulator [Rhodobacterales bacterium]|nr:GntR family transcriptional regulator [Rhodobacterales bacterium]